MNKIHEIVKEVIDREGGYNDDPIDRGGPTKWGVTIHTLSAWLGRPATIEDVKYLRRDVAFEILLNEFVIKPRFDEIENLELQEQVVDASVLHGQGRAAMLLQAAAGARADGIIGPMTLAAVNGGDAERIGCRMAVARTRFIARVVKSDPTQVRFIDGWVDRSTGFICT